MPALDEWDAPVPLWFAICASLAKSTEPLTLGQLQRSLLMASAGALGGNQSRLGVRLRRMLAEGLLEAITVPHTRFKDRTLTGYRLTDVGRDMFTSARALALQVLQVTGGSS